MRICLLVYEKLGESVRLQKQTRTLRALGHEVALICLGEKKQAEKWCGAVPIFPIVPIRSVAHLDVVHVCGQEQVQRERGSEFAGKKDPHRSEIEILQGGLA